MIKKTFIDESYAPELSSMKMVMSRGADELYNKGENEKAAALANKYFEAFPNFNFPYDYSCAIYRDTGKNKSEEDAEKQIEILVNEIDEYMQFFHSLENDKLNSFDIEIQKTRLAIDGLMRLLPKLKDENFKERMNIILQPYSEETKSNPIG
ncbi:MAG: hypothetical protein R2771_07235 [Saprospiraceae bacterium]